MIGIILLISLFAAYFVEIQRTEQQTQIETAINIASNNEMLKDLKARDFEARIDRLFPDHLDFQLKREIEQCQKLDTNVEYTNCVSENESLSSKRLNLYKTNFEKIQDGVEFSNLSEALFRKHENLLNEWCKNYTAYEWGGGSGTSQGVSHCKISVNAWFADILFTSANSLKFQRFKIPPQVERTANTSCTTQACIDDLNITIDHKIELIRKHIQQNASTEYQALSQDDISKWINSISHSNTQLIEVKNILCNELPLTFKIEYDQRSTLACENYIDQFRADLFTATHQSITSK